MAPSWAGPDARLETRELVRVVDATIADMPDAMRQIYLLVRQDDHSYRDAAAALGIGVGTVHTQLSRANALLRKAINDYRAASPTIETAPPDEESPSVSRAQ
jgi:RNA polymerase sigma-70 factor (ECF subfamily)